MKRWLACVVLGGCGLYESPPAQHHAMSDGGSTGSAGSPAMEELVGRYVRGDVTVYRGTATASDLPAQQGFDNAAVLAWLEIRPAETGELTFEANTVAQLTMIVPSTGQFVQVGEPDTNPAFVIASVVLDTPQGGNMPETCDQTCSVGNLFARPATISIPRFTASGTFEGPIQTTLQADLVAVEPATISFADLATFDATLANPIGDLQVVLPWQPDGSDMITTGQTGGACGVGDLYTVDMFVDASNPADYGVRDVVPISCD